MDKPLSAEVLLIQACRNAGFTDDYSKMIFRIMPDSANAFVEAIKEAQRQAVKYTLQQAAEKCIIYGNYMEYEIQGHIIELDEQILKDLEL